MSKAVHSSPGLRIVEGHEQQRVNRQVVVSSEEDMEPAIRIERTTCGLRIPNPADCTTTQSPRKQSHSDDLDEESSQMGFA
jgi:hypothetical protein